MLTQILNWETRRYNDLDGIKEKFDYYRALSAKGLAILTDEEFQLLKDDFNQFLNYMPTGYAACYPTNLFRVSFNKSITRLPGLGGRLEKISHLLSPPKQYTNFNRCNLPGESIFYCALDSMTAFWETRPQPKQLISLAEWRIKEGEFLNLSFVFNNEYLVHRNKEATGIFNHYNTVRNEWDTNERDVMDVVLRFISEEFIKTVDPKSPRDYFFSAHYVSQLLKPGPEGQLIHGVIYPSVKRGHCVSNIAISGELVLSKLELVSLKSKYIVSTNYTQEAIDNGTGIAYHPAYPETQSFDLEKGLIIHNDSVPDYLVGLEALAELEERKAKLGRLL